MSALYVLFKVAEADYALAAEQVLQLESYAGVTAVPGTLPHVTGIVQTRGRIVPVIDLRLLFGLPGVDAVLDTRIIVVERLGRVVGLRVDVSREVLRLEADGFQPTPAIVAERSQNFVLGVTRAGSRLLMLLDLAKVLGEDPLHDDSLNPLADGSAGRRALSG